MQRVNNWDLALVEWAESVRGKPYEWGVTDCGTLVRDACAAMYGREMFPEVKRWFDHGRSCFADLRTELDLPPPQRSILDAVLPSTTEPSGSTG